MKQSKIKEVGRDWILMGTACAEVRRKKSENRGHPETNRKERSRDQGCGCTATQMDLEGMMLSQISQTGEHKFCMISCLCGI